MEQSSGRIKSSLEIGKFNDENRQGANPEKQSEVFTMPAVRTSSREIAITLKGLRKTKRAQYIDGILKPKNREALEYV